MSQLSSESGKLFGCCGNDCTCDGDGTCIFENETGKAGEADSELDGR